MSQELRTKLASVGCEPDCADLECCGLDPQRVVDLVNEYGPAIVSLILRVLFTRQAPAAATAEQQAHLRRLLTQYGLQDSYDDIATSGLSPADVVTWVNQYGPRIVAVVLAVLDGLKKPAEDVTGAP